MKNVTTQEYTLYTTDLTIWNTLRAWLSGNKIEPIETFKDKTNGRWFYKAKVLVTEDELKSIAKILYPPGTRITLEKKKPNV